MADEWREALIGEAFEVNPSRLLKRGSIAPFVPMEVLPQHARAIERIDTREYTGSGMRFRNGDTLIARITPCLENGKTAFVSGLRDGEVAHGSTEYIVLSGKDGETDSLFGYYLARTPGFRRYAIGHMEGTSGRQRVPSSAIEQYSIALPCFEEQRAIANILGTLDDKIELNRRMNQTLEAMACALFKSWFVDFDGVPAEDMQESELGLIPKDWRVVALGDVAEQGKGSINPASTPEQIFTHYSLPAFDVAQLPLLESGHAIKSNKTPVPNNSVLVSKLNPHIPRIWLVGDAGDNAVCSTEFVVWAPKQPANSTFVYCLASSSMFNDAMRQLVTGTSNSHQRVRPEQLANIRVIAANDTVIAKFSEAAAPLMQKMLRHRQQSQSIAHLRDTLLPRLISGDLRLPDAEKMAAGAA